MANEWLTWMVLALAGIPAPEGHVPMGDGFPGVTNECPMLKVSPTIEKDGAGLEIRHRRVRHMRVPMPAEAFDSWFGANCTRAYIARFEVNGEPLLTIEARRRPTS